MGREELTVPNRLRSAVTAVRAAIWLSTARSWTPSQEASSMRADERIRMNRSAKAPSVQDSHQI